MYKLIYISNTQIPSEKANTYQSMVMCEAFSPYFNKVLFWYPNRRYRAKSQQIQDIYEYYSIKPNVFELNKLFCLDSNLLYITFKKMWFLTYNLTFAFNYIFKLRQEAPSSIVFTRDTVGLFLIGIAKKRGLIKQKIFFEAHSYSKKQSDLIKNLNGLVVINQYLKELYLKDGVKNILVAHDGVKLDDYIHLEPNLKKKNPSNIVYVGNLFEWKGVYTLADSMHYINNAKLIVVGGSSDTLPYFQNYIQENKIINIELTGFIPHEETIKYIQDADILVLPNSSKDKMSYYTSPLKMFEYMASKRPIIASRLPSIQEVLQDGVNAILFEPDNSRDLADKIKYTLTSDTSYLVQKAFEDVVEYTWHNRAKKIVEFIKEKI